MNVVVCVKQIPDPAAPQALDPETKTLVRQGKLILDDSDAYGVEMGLQLADQAGGDVVTLVSMAPNGETSGLRTALAMGADKAILVSDDALKGSDALSTAKVLAKAIARAEPDLIIAATESTDGYTGTFPVQLAELLGLPSITFAKKVSVADGKVTVDRQTEAGYDEVECSLPAVVTVTAGVVEPRYPSFKGIMAAKSKRAVRARKSPTSRPPTHVRRARSSRTKATVSRTSSVSWSSSSSSDPVPAPPATPSPAPQLSTTLRSTHQCRSTRSGFSPRWPTGRSSRPRSSC
jgi:electron transfer flavoprotein beta subunit